MLRGDRLDQSRGLAIEAIQRLIEQPDRRALADQPGKRGALALAGRKETDGHVEQPCKTEARGSIGGRTIDPPPESQRVAQRQMRIECRPFVDQADCALLLDGSRVGTHQPGENADQAGFADTVGSGDLQCFTRLQRQRESAEQHTVAAPAGKIVGGDTAWLHGATR